MTVRPSVGSSADLRTHWHGYAWTGPECWPGGSRPLRRATGQVAGAVHEGGRRVFRADVAGYDPVLPRVWPTSMKPFFWDIRRPSRTTWNVTSLLTMRGKPGAPSMSS
ncbi:hypothetical protein GA0115259_1068417 [Streptomyces sp. MnatMP-M17]|nr:hypothetical protein GA0115259_1068417 [Streptomyces sp. MnatMP-M17]